MERTVAAALAGGPKASATDVPVSVHGASELPVAHDVPISLPEEKSGINVATTGDGLGQNEVLVDNPTHEAFHIACDACQAWYDASSLGLSGR